MDRALRDSLAEAEDRHWWFEGRRRILQSVLQVTGARGPVAEIGCGNGANLAMLSSFGEVSAVEPDATDRARAEARGIGHVRRGSLPTDIPLSQGGFGLVLALDVIEHVENDEAAVRSLAGLCRPDGLVVITVPAGPWLWSRHDERNGHFRRYTRDGLRRLITHAGLEVVRLTSFNTVLLPVVATARTAGRMLGLDTAGTSLPPTPINQAFLKLLSLEARLLPRIDLPAGVSLLALAHPA